MLVEGALAPPCPGFAVGKPAMVVVRVQGAPYTRSSIIRDAKLYTAARRRPVHPGASISACVAPPRSRALRLKLHQKPHRVIFCLVLGRKQRQIASFGYGNLTTGRKGRRAYIRDESLS